MDLLLVLVLWISHKTFYFDVSLDDISLMNSWWGAAFGFSLVWYMFLSSLKSGIVPGNTHIIYSLKNIRLSLREHQMMFHWRWVVLISLLSLLVLEHLIPSLMVYRCTALFFCDPKDHSLNLAWDCRLDSTFSYANNFTTYTTNCSVLGLILGRSVF